MAAKKERGRFSLRFNISDPIHLATVELLEKQPDHGKAQYIANAVVFYDTHFADDQSFSTIPTSRMIHNR